MNGNHPATSPSSPALPPVIPALQSVIPAKAGTHGPDYQGKSRPQPPSRHSRASSRHSREGGNPRPRLSGHVAAPNPHAQWDHFVSYDSATTVGPIGPKSATKKQFSATTVVSLSATISPTQVPRKALRGDEVRPSQIQMAPILRPLSCPSRTTVPKLAQSYNRTKNQPRKSAILAKRSEPDTNDPHPPPSLVPQSDHRSQAGSKLQSDQNQPRKSAILAKRSEPDTNDPHPPPSLVPQSDHRSQAGSKLQSDHKSRRCPRRPRPHRNQAPDVRGVTAPPLIPRSDLPAGWKWTKLRDAISDLQPGFACGERDTTGVVQVRMHNVSTVRLLQLGRIDTSSVQLHRHVQVLGGTRRCFVQQYQ